MPNNALGVRMCRHSIGGSTKLFRRKRKSGYSTTITMNHVSFPLFNMGKNYRKSSQMHGQNNREHTPKPPRSKIVLALAYEKRKQG